MFIAITPMATPRIRVTKTGHSYYPGEYENYLCELDLRLREGLNKGLLVKHTTPVKLAVSFYLPIPKQIQYVKIPKNLSAQMDDHPAFSKPDLDNLVKGIMDAAVRAQVIKRDELVCKIEAEKRYTNSTVGIHIAIIPLPMLERLKNLFLSYLVQQT